MKKLLSFVVLGTLIVACNSSSSSSVSTDSTATSPTNVENVNGNVPDTASGTNLSHPLPVDSSRMKDSAGKKPAHH